MTDLRLKLASTLPALKLQISQPSLKARVLPGVPGVDGSAGVAATIAVGTVTTLSPGSPATVTNAGTSAAAVFDFGIPKGADGAGTGDVVGPAASIDSEIALFSSTTGKLIKRATGTGVVHATSGVYSVSTVITAEIADDAVTFAKMQNIATDRLIGRDTAATGDPEEIALNATLEWTGTGSIQRAALTGDVTAAAGSNATTIASSAVTYAKIQNISATDKLLGRQTAGAGVVEEITCTAAGRALIDDAAASNQRTTLGLGTIATFDETTAAQYQANTAGKALSTDKVWSAADIVGLTDAATIAVDMATGFNFSVTLGGNRTLGNPTNTKNGQTGVIIVTQDATGTRTLAYGTNWEFAGGTAPTLSTAANTKDMLFYFVQSSTSIIITGIIKAVV
jgi:hypothetical protein